VTGNFLVLSHGKELHCHRHSQSQARLLPWSSTYVGPGLMQAPLPRRGGKADSCCYASRSELQIWPWHKQLQSCPKLHELSLLLSPKERKCKEVESHHVLPQA